jgi:hypothetical protein
MRRFFTVLLSSLCVFALLFCAGCAPDEPPRDALAYQTDGASITVSGSIGELKFAAVIHLSPCENAVERDFTIEYTAPAALLGVSVSRRADIYEARLDTVSVSGDAARRLARPVEAFALGGEISKISAEDGETLLTLACGEVAIVNGEPQRIKIVCGDGVPLAVNIEKYVKEGTKQ